jgi:hypothetical protein
MTKLYHGPEGQGWQIPGQQDRKAARLDVPSSPADLAAWLNERAVPADPAACNTATIDELEAADAGAVLTAADVAKVNADRPTFLPDLSADEIERRRMAIGQCPKCATVKPNWMRAAIDGIASASIDELEAVANAIRDHTTDLNQLTKGKAN